MKNIIGVHEYRRWWWAVSRVSRLRRKCYTAVEALAHYNAAIRLRMMEEQFRKFVTGRNNVWRLRPDPPTGRVHDVRVIDIDDRNYVMVDERAYEELKDTPWFVLGREILAVERAEKLDHYPWLKFHYVRLADLVAWGIGWRERPHMVNRDGDWRDCRVERLIPQEKFDPNNYARGIFGTV